MKIAVTGATGFVSEYEVATIAREICGSNSKIVGEPMQPKHQIDIAKIRACGMRFGGPELLRETVGDLVKVAQG